MKWILIISLIIIIMLIAISISRQYNEKFIFYTNLKIFLEQFRINISFRQKKINEFLSDVKSNKVFVQFIECYQEYLDSGEINVHRIKILDKDELVDIEMIIKGIGRYDVKNEIMQIDTFLHIVADRLERATKEKEKLGPLIIKLSLLFSLALAILLI
ncbi:MAG: hypothetical protein IKC49_01120 [Clostridia bacterium]|nr:hypothetical protein [Clostridia bacterium]